MLAIVTVGAFLLLAPRTLGGSNSYVTTHGISMEPRFSTGDLAVLRQPDDYRVGDIVGYHSDLLDTVVMHRIVKVAGGHYTFKGDNNSWLDPETPGRDQLLGRLVMRVPHGGIWLQRLSDPRLLAALGFAVLAGGGAAARTTRRRKRGTMRQHARPSWPSRTFAALPPWARSAAALIAVAGVAGVALAALAWARPITTVETRNIESSQQMTFSYHATVPESAAYDRTTVTAPDPIFRNLTDSLDVHYAYQGQPGSIAVAAELSTSSGWHSTVRLGPRVNFDTATYAGSVRLHLDELEQRASAAAKVTGIPATQVDVTLRALVRATDGTRFTPALAFTLTPLQLRLAGNKSSLSVQDSTPRRVATTAPGTLGFAGHQITVSTARTVGLAMAVGAIFAGCLLGLAVRVGAPATEAGRIRRRYASMLVPVQPVPAPPGHSIIDVGNIATLAKLAERYGLLILHWARSGVETFIVQDESATYRFRIGTGTEMTSSEPIEAPITSQCLPS
ncbi:MAG TPA: signal peptidase I [Nocardioidaceae bacterium]|nr:signal peptidase I [Nocardioidaceae bacterium]